MPDEPITPTPQAPLNPDLMGYPNTEALVAAKRAGDAEAKRLFDENQKLNGIVAQFLTSGDPNGRQNVPDRRGRTPEEELTAMGVPVEALDNYFDKRFNKALAPLTNGVQARGKVVADHPDYIQFENDVANFINTDPDLSQRYPRMFEADPAGAMEYAFLKFGESRRRTIPAPPNGGAGNPVDAQIPTSRAGDARRAPDGSEELQKLYEEFQRTGSSRSAAAYAQARLHTVITDQHLNQ